MSKTFGDIAIGRKGFTIKETGAFVTYGEFMSDALTWLPYHTKERLRAMKTHGISPRRFTVSFTPAPARSFYLIRAVLLAAGAKIVPNSLEADLSVHFEDQTAVSGHTRPPARLHYNYDCLDISKTHVAKVFEEVFGYALAVDPLTFEGKMVQKSELNAAHDGQVIEGPIENPLPGCVYQKVIDNRTDHGTVLDLRCPTAKGQVPLIYLKERPEHDRFKNYNTTCILGEVNDYLSLDEQKLIARFCEQMKLDWGGLDVLRHKGDGRIYIVDVNKTDMGPPMAMRTKDKLTSTAILAKTLTHLINAA